MNDQNYKQQLTAISSYASFTKIVPITKGISGDKKYYIETNDGKRYLLRVTDIDAYDQKKTEFEVMKQVTVLGVPKRLYTDRLCGKSLSYSCALLPY